MTSFSVFEDESCAEQSSFAPYHDSWSSAPSRGNQGGNVSEREKSLKEYHAPLEARVMTEKRERLNETIDQTFTQFDIRHPQKFDPVSTPMGARQGELFRPPKYNYNYVAKTRPYYCWQMQLYCKFVVCILILCRIPSPSYPFLHHSSLLGCICHT